MPGTNKNAKAAEISQKFLQAGQGDRIPLLESYIKGLNPFVRIRRRSEISGIIEKDGTYTDLISLEEIWDEVTRPGRKNEGLFTRIFNNNHYSRKSEPFRKKLDSLLSNPGRKSSEIIDLLVEMRQKEGPELRKDFLQEQLGRTGLQDKDRKQLTLLSNLEMMIGSLCSQLDPEEPEDFSRIRDQAQNYVDAVSRINHQELLFYWVSKEESLSVHEPAIRALLRQSSPPKAETAPPRAENRKETVSEVIEKIPVREAEKVESQPLKSKPVLPEDAKPRKATPVHREGEEVQGDGEFVLSLESRRLIAAVLNVFRGMYTKSSDNPWLSHILNHPLVYPAEKKEIEEKAEIIIRRSIEKEPEDQRRREIIEDYIIKIISLLNRAEDSITGRRKLEIVKDKYDFLSQIYAVYVILAKRDGSTIDLEESDEAPAESKPQPSRTEVKIKKASERIGQFIETCLDAKERRVKAIMAMEDGDEQRKLALSELVKEPVDRYLEDLYGILDKPVKFGSVMAHLNDNGLKSLPAASKLLLLDMIIDKTEQNSNGTTEEKLLLRQLRTYRGHMGDTQQLLSEVYGKLNAIRKECGDDGEKAFADQTAYLEEVLEDERFAPVRLTISHIYQNMLESQWKELNVSSLKALNPAGRVEILYQLDRIFGRSEPVHGQILEYLAQAGLSDMYRQMETSQTRSPEENKAELKQEWGHQLNSWSRHIQRETAPEEPLSDEEQQILEEKKQESREAMLAISKTVVNAGSFRNVAHLQFLDAHENPAVAQSALQSVIDGLPDCEKKTQFQDILDLSRRISDEAEPLDCAADKIMLFRFWQESDYQEKPHCREFLEGQIQQLEYAENPELLTELFRRLSRLDNSEEKAELIRQCLKDPDYVSHRSLLQNILQKLEFGENGNDPPTIPEILKQAQTFKNDRKGLSDFLNMQKILYPELNSDTVDAVDLLLKKNREEQEESVLSEQAKKAAIKEKRKGPVIYENCEDLIEAARQLESPGSRQRLVKTQEQLHPVETVFKFQRRLLFYLFGSQKETGMERVKALVNRLSLDNKMKQKLLEVLKQEDSVTLREMMEITDEDISRAAAWLPFQSSPLSKRVQQLKTMRDENPDMPFRQYFGITNDQITEVIDSLTFHKTELDNRKGEAPRLPAEAKTNRAVYNSVNKYYINGSRQAGDAERKTRLRKEVVTKRSEALSRGDHGADQELFMEILQKLLEVPPAALPDTVNYTLIPVLDPKTERQSRERLREINDKVIRPMLYREQELAEQNLAELQLGQKEKEILKQLLKAMEEDWTKLMDYASSAKETKRISPRTQGQQSSGAAEVFADRSEGTDRSQRSSGPTRGGSGSIFGSRAGNRTKAAQSAPAGRARNNRTSSGKPERRSATENKTQAKDSRKTVPPKVPEKSRVNSGGKMAEKAKKELNKKINKHLQNIFQYSSKLAELENFYTTYLRKKDLDSVIIFLYDEDTAESIMSNPNYKNDIDLDSKKLEKIYKSRKKELAK